MGAILPAVLLALQVAVSLLDAGALTHDVAVESRHDPATCPRAHDHRVCPQVGRVAAVSSPAAGVPLARAGCAGALGAVVPPPRSALALHPTLPRAPPL